MEHSTGSMTKIYEDNHGKNRMGIKPRLWLFTCGWYKE